jgi:hypothetical protein
MSNRVEGRLERQALLAPKNALVGPLGDLMVGVVLCPDKAVFRAVDHELAAWAPVELRGHQIRRTVEDFAAEACKLS